MKKIKTSLLARIIAWVLISISGLSMVGSGIALIEMHDYGIYSRTYEELLDSVIAEMSDRYSIRAIDDFIYMPDSDYLTKNNVKYGITRTNTNEKIDFSSKEEFVVDRFDRKLNNNDKFDFTQHTYYVSPNSFFVFSNLLFGDNYYHGGQVYTKDRYEGWSSHYADSINYDNKYGVIYYYAHDLDFYYPAKKVVVYFMNKAFTYEYKTDVDNIDGYYLTLVSDALLTSSKKMINENGEEINIATIEGLLNDKESIYEDEVYTYGEDITLKKNEVVSILRALTDFEGPVNFQELHMYNFSILDVDKMLLDDVRSIVPRDSIREISLNSRYMPSEEYYLNEYYALTIKDAITAEDFPVEVGYYTVVILSPTDVTPKWDGNLYERGIAFLNLAYGSRNIVIVLFAITAFVSIALLIFLMTLGGYKLDNSTREVELSGTFWQKLPWEIVVAIYLCVIGVCGAFTSALGNLFSLDTPFFITLSIIVLTAGLATTSFLIDFAIRVKLGKWWRNTICCRVLAFAGRIFKRIFKGIKHIYDNKGLLKKLWLVCIVIIFIQFLGFVIIAEMYGRNRYLMLLTAMFLFDGVAIVVLSKIVIQMQILQDGAVRITKGDLGQKIDTLKLSGEFKKHGEALNSVNDGIAIAVNEKMKSEHFKTELITNVSHDIKTPLTSIINYVDLLSKEDLQNEKASEYLEVLDRQSSKLKKLIEDLVEASKASSGNLSVQMEELDLGVFLTQTVGDWTEKLENNNLQLIVAKPEQPVYIKADGRHLWRVVDNLMNNIFKYAQPGSRVYVNLEQSEMVVLTFRNISKYPLNISSEELLERFVRGDQSRHTEGHGLGLSIAQSLINLMDAKLNIYIDGDLFKVVLSFDNIKD